MEPKYITANEYAKTVGLHYRTVVRHIKNGLIEGYVSNTGRIYANNPKYQSCVSENNENKAILYARVSSTVNKASLDGQIERMRMYAAARGYEIVGEYKEIASGLNDDRRMLNQILKREDYGILLSEHKDRLTRFGFNYIKTLLEKLGIEVEIINQTESKNQEIIDDFISIITSFCGKIYGSKRRAKTEKIIEELKNED